MYVLLTFINVCCLIQRGCKTLLLPKLSLVKQCYPVDVALGQCKSTYMCLLAVLIWPTSHTANCFFQSFQLLMVGKLLRSITGGRKLVHIIHEN